MASIQYRILFFLLMISCAAFGQKRSWETEGDEYEEPDLKIWVNVGGEVFTSGRFAEDRYVRFYDYARWDTVQQMAWRFKRPTFRITAGKHFQAIAFLPGALFQKPSGLISRQIWLEGYACYRFASTEKLFQPYIGLGPNYYLAWRDTDEAGFKASILGIDPVVGTYIRLARRWQLGISLPGIGGYSLWGRQAVRLKQGFGQFGRLEKEVSQGLFKKTYNSNVPRILLEVGFRLR